MLTSITPEEPKVTREKAEKWGPKIKHEEVPTFKTKYEAEKYKDREIQRILEGYNGVTGEHYEYVQHYKIKDGYGAKIKPWWRDTDGLIVFPTLDECDKQRYDDFTLKRREFGFSSIAGYRANKYAQRYPGSVINITSYSEKAMEKLMKQKIRFMGEHCFEDFEAKWIDACGTKYPGLKPKVLWNEGSTSLRYVDADNGSVIQGIQTTRSKDAAKNMEGDRIVFAFIDEFFLHPFATDVRASADASRKVGFINAGRISLGGSAGNATEDGARKAMDIWHNHETMGVKILFIPGYMSIDWAEERDDRGVKTGKLIPLTCNGWSLVEEAKEWIHKTRKVLYSLADKTEYHQFVKAYPIEPEEVFETTGTGAWDADEKARFEKQKKWIAMNPQDCMKPVVLQDNISGSITPKFVSQSNEMMLEAPIPNELYIAGCDPIPFVARKDSEKLSELSMAIKRASTNEYVYYLKERSRDPSKLTAKMIRALKYYNDAMLMIERNRGDVIIREFEATGNKSFLSKEPPPFRPKSSKSIEIGYTKNIHNMDALASNLMVFARYYDEDRKTGGIESIKDREMLDQVFGFDEGNKDLADAMIACELLHWWLREFDKRRRDFNERRTNGNSKMVPVVTYRNGSRQIIYVESNKQVLGLPIVPSKKNPFGK